MNTYYFVRHAHAYWTPDESRPLSANGQKDAQRVADILEKFPISMIFSSPYKRAFQTVIPLSEQFIIPIDVISNLRERTLCKGKIDKFLEAVEMTWRDFEFSHPGGESNNAAQHRGVSFIHKLEQKFRDEHIVLATHGNLMALTMQFFDTSIDFSFWESLSMPDIYVLEVDADKQAHILRLWENSNQ